MIPRCLPILLVLATGLSAQNQSQNNPDKNAQRAYPEKSTRGNTRIFFWGGDHSVGQCNVDYGRPRWRAELGAQLDQKRGRRWRFGQNHWTNLDTNIALEFIGLDGKTIHVPAGLYYLTLEKTAGPQRDPASKEPQPDAARYVLTLLKPDAIRRARLDAYHAHKTKGGIRIPLGQRTVTEIRKELDIRLHVLDRQSAPKKQQCLMMVRFGPHELKCTFQMVPEAPEPLRPDVPPPGDGKK